MYHPGGPGREVAPPRTGAAHGSPDACLTPLTPELEAARKGCVLDEDHPCMAALVGIFEALRNTRPKLSARGVAAADVIAADVFDAASRLSLVHAALSSGDSPGPSLPMSKNVGRR